MGGIFLIISKTKAFGEWEKKQGDFLRKFLCTESFTFVDAALSKLDFGGLKGIHFSGN